MAIATKQMTALQALPSAASSMRQDHGLRTQLEVTHKALRCWLLGQQKPFPQHYQQRSTPAEAAAPHNASQSLPLRDALARPRRLCLLHKRTGKAKHAIEHDCLAHLNMGTVRYRNAVTPDTT